MPSDAQTSTAPQKPQKDPKRVITGKCRLNYANLFTARVGPDGGDPTYSYTLIFEPGTDMTPIKNAAWAAAQEKWGDKAKTMTLRNPIRSNSDREGQAGYTPGGVFLNCRSKAKIQVVDGAKRPITSPDDIYSGCFVRAALIAFAYDQKGNKGVSFAAGPLQKWEDGERLDNRISADQAFEPLPGAEMGPFGGDDDANPFG